jgi:molecular chaperone DnaK
VSQLQEALFGLNRRLANERRAEAGPLQGLKNTLGSLKDELFADDDWDEWERSGRGDPWSTPPRPGPRSDRSGYDRAEPAADRFDRNDSASERYARRGRRPDADDPWSEY